MTTRRGFLKSMVGSIDALAVMPILTKVKLPISPVAIADMPAPAIASAGLRSTYLTPQIILNESLKLLSENIKHMKTSSYDFYTQGKSIGSTLPVQKPIAINPMNT
jgi:hypothetical protein